MSILTVEDDDRERSSHACEAISLRFSADGSAVECWKVRLYAAVPRLISGQILHGEIQILNLGENRTLEHRLIGNEGVLGGDTPYRGVEMLE